MFESALSYPNIDPVAIEFGPIVVRWYALSYVAGFLLGAAYMKRMNRYGPAHFSGEQIDRFLLWAIIAVIIGARVFYVLFYNLEVYIHNPLSVFALWEGGLSFHGGFFGMAVAIYCFARRHRTDWRALSDLVAPAATIGIFFGRIANFINGELWGRVTTSQWGMIFPNAGPLPRHPSQLYEAALEGVFLFCLLTWLIVFRKALHHPGRVTGVFVFGYGCARFLVEFFRQPDAQLGILLAGMTMGQWLTLPLLAGGAWLVLRARRT